MYDVTIFYNTGYNASNLPDSPARILNKKSKSLPSTDIMQNRWLSSITVNCSYLDLENADYCKIGNMYYVITNVQMTSPDVAILGLYPDFIASMGGASALKFGDGITERYCVKEDNYGEYTESDPLLNCSKPLEIISGGEFFNFKDSDGPVLIESTIDLKELATYDEAITCFTEGTENGVTYPKVPALSPNTHTSCYMHDGTGKENFRHTPATVYYRAASEDIRESMARVRALGLESSIIYQYILPHGYYKDIYTVENDLDDNDHDPIGKIEGVDITEVTSAPFIYDTDIKNMRVLYGQNNQYTMLSIGTGNKATFDPEDIYDGNTAPSIRMITDPRASGCPYFRFNSYLNDTNNFFYNCITGNAWQSAPLVWTDKSGYAWSNYAWNTKLYQKYEENQKWAVNTAFDRMGSILDVVNPLSYSYNSADGGSGQNTITSPTLGMFGKLTEQALSAKYHDYNQQRSNNQLLNDIAKDYSVAPEINFPRTDGLRDYVGNGILVYRTVPSKTDRQKQDKLLTMYGYKDMRPVESWMLTCRKNFNYIKLTDCSIINPEVPQWMREGAKAQLLNGVRFWHTDVSETAYTSNPIV